MAELHRASSASQTRPPAAAQANGTRFCHSLVSASSSTFDLSSFPYAIIAYQILNPFHSISFDQRRLHYEFTLTSLNNALIGQCPFEYDQSILFLTFPLFIETRLPGYLGLSNRTAAESSLFGLCLMATSEAKSCVISFKSHPAIAGDIPNSHPVIQSFPLAHFSNSPNVTLAALASAFFG